MGTFHSLIALLYEYQVIFCSTDADEAANALGKWGVDLTNMDADLAVAGTVPNTIKINARDAKKTPRLANSAVVRTRKNI